MQVFGGMRVVLIKDIAGEVLGAKGRICSMPGANSYVRGVLFEGKDTPVLVSTKDFVVGYKKEDIDTPLGEAYLKTLNSVYLGGLEFPFHIKKAFMEESDIPKAVDYEHLKPLVKSVEYSDTVGCLRVYTKPIVLKYCNRESDNAPELAVELGEFVVEIHTALMRSLYIRMYAQKEGVTIDGLYAHPHVHEAKPCLGTFYDPIRQALIKGDYVQVIINLLQFLRTYSKEGGPYRGLWDWLPMVARDKVCSECLGYLDDGCTCPEPEEEVEEEVERCAYCDNRLEECECVSCLVTGTIEPNEGCFPAHCCTSCPHLCRDVEKTEEYFSCRQLMHGIPLLISCNADRNIVDAVEYVPELMYTTRYTVIDMRPKKDGQRPVLYTYNNAIEHGIIKSLNPKGDTNETVKEFAEGSAGAGA